MGLFGRVEREVKWGRPRREARTKERSKVSCPLLVQFDASSIT